jgi:Zn-dependent peptidase ImmA (M78 family)
MRTRREIEEKVRLLLKKHDISDAPVSVDMIARSEGLPIVESAFAGDVSGALLRKDGVAGIVVNAQQHPNRKRFTIAHELAHFLLDHTDTDHVDWQFTILRRDESSSDASDVREIEANAFAANLLMPKDFLRRDLDQYRNFRGELELDDACKQALAKRYRVSEIALTYRLVNLGFIPPV